MQLFDLICMLTLGHIGYIAEMLDYFIFCACLFFQIINRGLLRWLKLWDYVVFGKENKTRNVISNPKPHKDKIDNANKKSFNPSEAVDELDPFKRPVFKVLTSSFG